MREKILRETFRLLLDKGVDGASITDIQKAVGMSRALIYHYFKNKDELVLEACKLYFFSRYDVRDRNISDITCKDSLEIMVDSLRNIEKELSSDNSRAVKIENYNALFYRTIHLYPEIRKQYEFYKGQMAQVLKNAIVRGEIKNSIDPEPLARYFLYAFEGVANYIQPSERKDIYATMLAELMKLYELVKVEK